MGQHDDRTFPEGGAHQPSLKALAARALARQAQPASSEREETAKKPLSLVPVLTVRSNRDGTQGQQPARADKRGLVELMRERSRLPDPNAWIMAALAEGEPPDVILEMEELSRRIAEDPPPARRKLWGVGDWPAYFGERAGIREYDGGLARAEAENLAYIDCIGLYLRRHKPMWAGNECVACWQSIDEIPCDVLRCENNYWGFIHVACEGPYRLVRIRRAMYALAALGVRDPKGH
jgi:hypothetical protein